MIRMAEDATAVKLPCLLHHRCFSCLTEQTVPPQGISTGTPRTYSEPYGLSLRSLFTPCFPGCMAADIPGEALETLREHGA